MNGDKVILVYDGYCRLCSWGVAWILAQVPPHKIRFIPQQAPEGAALMAKAGLDALAPQSIAVIDGDSILTKSKAVLHLLKRCGGVWAWMAMLSGLIPAAFADRLYTWLAARRYRWFGRLGVCYIPENAAKGAPDRTG
jgi:predicted DCC family thiol-disulfide oxidoreductase YuxK